MEDLIELYKRRDALAKENSDVSEITNIINENWVVKEPKPIILTHSYYENPDFYEHYDNYNAIEVPRVELMPYDYEGVMGVPLTFLGARNRIYIPDYTSIPKCNETKNFCINYLCSQFEIIDARAIALNDKQKNKNTYLIKDADGAINGKPTYARICIKKKDDLTPTPAQFEIIGITENADYLKPLYLDGFEKYDRGYVNGKRMYSRLLIKKVS